MVNEVINSETSTVNHRTPFVSSKPPQESIESGYPVPKRDMTEIVHGSSLKQIIALLLVAIPSIVDVLILTGVITFPQNMLDQSPFSALAIIASFSYISFFLIPISVGLLLLEMFKHPKHSEIGLITVAGSYAFFIIPKPFLVLSVGDFYLMIVAALILNVSVLLGVLGSAFR